MTTSYRTGAVGLGLTNAPTSLKELEEVMADFVKHDLVRLKERRHPWLSLCRRILNLLSAILGSESPGMQTARKRIAPK